MKKKKIKRNMTLGAIVMLCFINFMFINQNKQTGTSLSTLNHIAYASDEIEVDPPDIGPFSFIKWLEDLLKGNSKQ